MPSPEIIAHRGTPREHPENTLPAFSRALELGVDGIELDVHATADGVVVVHHDPVPRAEPPDARYGSRPIASMRAAELGRFRVGGTRIPTLAEVLELVATRAVVYVEIKAPGIERPVVDCVGAARAECAVHGFDHRVALRVRELAPRIPTGILMASYALDPAALLSAARARDYWQRWDQIDAVLVERVHSAGGRVVAWTVNESGAGSRLAAMGVDSLCSDVPDELAPIRG